MPLNTGEKSMNVIFDIGGVLLDFDWEKFVGSMFDAETARAVSDATWYNPDWNEFDLGNHSDEEVLQMFIKKAPDFENEIRLMFSRLGEALVKKSGTIPLIEKLKADGYGVYYLSNYFEYLMHIAPEPIKFIHHMDGGIFSCHVHTVKPQPEIYNELCRRYGLRNEDCVFIDDRQINVDGAVNTGMKGILYAGQTEDELYEQITV